MKAKFTCGHFVKTTPNLKFVGNDLRVVPQKTQTDSPGGLSLQMFKKSLLTHKKRGEFHPAFLLLFPENLFYRFRIAVTVQVIRLEITGLSPLIPAVYRDELDISAIAV